jgi:hypothetical protein
VLGLHLGDVNRGPGRARAARVAARPGLLSAARGRAIFDRSHRQSRVNMTLHLVVFLRGG